MRPLSKYPHAGAALQRAYTSKLACTSCRTFFRITRHKHFATVAWLGKGRRLARGWLPGSEVGTWREILARGKVGTWSTGIGTRSEITAWREVTTGCASLSAGRELSTRCKVAAWRALTGKAIVKTTFTLITETFAGRPTEFAGSSIGKSTTAISAAKAAFTRTGKTAARATGIAATTAIARSKAGARCFGNALLGL